MLPIVVALAVVGGYVLICWLFVSPASSPPAPVARIQVGVVEDAVPAHVVADAKAALGHLEDDGTRD